MSNYYEKMRKKILIGAEVYHHDARKTIKDYVMKNHYPVILFTDGTECWNIANITFIYTKRQQENLKIAEVLG